MVEEHKQQIREQVEWSVKTPLVSGGQHCGMITPPVVLKSEVLDLEITIGFHRSQQANKEFAWALFELALDELIK